MTKGSKYILKTGEIRGYCSRCSKYYKLEELDRRLDKFYCKKHNCQCRLKRRKRIEDRVVRY